MSKPKVYLDENVAILVAEQLRQIGIEVVTAQELGVLGSSDIQHLMRAKELGYVFCTHDKDFTRLHNSGMEHYGIVFGKQDRMTIAKWISGLQQYHDTLTAEEMINKLFRLGYAE
jgi:predicted nuclease of predicted toxin-antitoxin system